MARATMMGQGPPNARRTLIGRAIVSAAVVVGVLFLAMVAPAWEPKVGVKEAPEAAAAKSVTVKLLDFELLDQDSRRVRLKTDIAQDRVVIIDTIYTSCPVVCPILSGVFASLQDSLGDRLGKDVLLVSISVDPTTDTPPRLKDYAQRWKAGPGWLFLTGPRRNVAEVLKGLNAYAPTPAEHPTMILVGDARQGRWRRFYGFPAPEQVLAEVDALHASRAEASDRAGRRER